MIDCEAEVFSAVATALRAKFPQINLSNGERIPAIGNMPAAVGREMDNSTYIYTLSSSGQENHAVIMWQWDVYSSKVSGRKAECKSILAVIDEQMFGMGFARFGSAPLELPNEAPTVYRMVARYRAVVSKDKILYRR